MLRIFHHYIPSSIIWLIIIEFVVLYISVFVGIELRYIESSVPDHLILDIFFDTRAALFSLSLSLSMTAMGLHARNINYDFAEIMIRLALSFMLGFLVLTFLFYLLPELFLGRGVFILALLVAFFGILITRTTYQKFNSNLFLKKKILVLGTSSKAHILSELKNNLQKTGHNTIGYVCVDQNTSRVPKNNIIEIETSLLDLALKYDIDEIVLAIDDRRNGFPMRGLLECKMKGIVVWDLVTFLERITGHIELDVLHPSDIIFSSGFTNAVKPRGSKRLLDISTSLIILVLSSPVILITAIVIWLSTFGKEPVFYRQQRVGLCGRPFSVLKFRSMIVDAEINGAQFAKNKDYRITRIGKLIRKARIDELPQLINVLKGEMSFVGPRPERPEFVLKFEQSIPHYALRHTVKPGITGWAQICYPYGETEDDAQNKLHYDIYYIKNYSLFLDATILLQTIQVVLFGQGSR